MRAALIDDREAWDATCTELIDAAATERELAIDARDCEASTDATERELENDAREAET